MQRQSVPRRRPPSRIPRLRGSLGDLRPLHTDLTHHSHDSGISRSVSLVSLASAAPHATSRRRARSRPDVLDEDDDDSSVVTVSGGCRPARLDRWQVHGECFQALNVAQTKIQELTAELAKKQLEIDKLRMENGARSFRESPKEPAESDPFLDIMQLQKLIMPASKPEAKDTSEDEDDFSEVDDSLIEFWSAMNRKKASAIPNNLKSELIPCSSSTPVHSEKSSDSGTWTLDKAHGLLSSSTTCTSSKSLDNLMQSMHISKPIKSRPSSMVFQQPQRTEWKQCINRPRPSKLNLTKATEEATIMKRLESPAAISLLSPRPFNRQNCIPNVPPLDLSSLVSDSSESSRVKQMGDTNKRLTAEYNHMVVLGAQRNASLSRALLQNVHGLFQRK